MWRQLEKLDAMLQAGVAGQEPELVAWMNQRAALLEAWLQTGPDKDGLDEVAGRTRQLQEKFLHWRRAAIMEQSSIDQHTRFVQEQRLDASASSMTYLDIQA